jgi:hypothetical protein
MNYKNLFGLKSHASLPFDYKIAFWAVGILLASLLWAAGQPMKSSIDPLILQHSPLPFTPNEFYIAEVIDERKDKSAVAHLFPIPKTSELSKYTVPIDLKGGGGVAIREFFLKSTVPNSKLRPVIARLKEVRVTETAGDKGRVNGTVVVHIAFNLKQNTESVPLLEFKGGAKYIRPASQHNVIAPLLGQSLVEGLRYFNSWIEREKDKNELLAKSLKVNFQDYKSSGYIQDTVFYDKNKALTWNDFTATPNLKSKYAAAVFPGFSYEGQTEVRDGVINLNLAMKVFVVKEGSWVKDAARDAYSLNHEQRHFDIAKIIAERFKLKIYPDSLTLSDYNSIIQYKYIESFREMNRMQEQYDQETKHGIDQVAQQRWNQKIDKELKLF